MRFIVAKDFIDRHTKEYFPPGSVYETADESRVAELKEGGFLGDELKPPMCKGKSNADQRSEAQNNDPA